MKLTEKDQEFIEKLKMLIDDRDLKIELKEDGLKRFVLRRNYGDKIEKVFGLTRQGIRWRFQRLLGDIYISAYVTIYWVESLLGTELRAMALEIAKQRIELRKKAMKGTGYDKLAILRHRQTR